MLTIFSVDPRFILGLASILGCLYFLCVCAEDAKSLLAYWRHQNPRPPKKPVRYPVKKFADLCPEALRVAFTRMDS